MSLTGPIMASSSLLSSFQSCSLQSSLSSRFWPLAQPGSTIAGLEAQQWCCQFNANQSAAFADEQVPGAEKIAPLAQFGVVLLIEGLSKADFSFEIEVVAH
jgi:hypothetical protein